jgi:hypothetical protein
MTIYKKYVNLLDNMGWLDVKKWAKPKDAEKWLENLLTNRTVIDFLANDSQLSTKERERSAKEYFHNCVARFDGSKKLRLYPRVEREGYSRSWDNFMKDIVDSDHCYIDAGYQSYIVLDLQTNSVFIIPAWLFYHTAAFKAPHVLADYGDSVERTLIGMIDYENKGKFNINKTDLDVFFKTSVIDYNHNRSTVLMVQITKLLLNLPTLPLYSFDKRMSRMEELKRLAEDSISSYWTGMYMLRSVHKKCNACEKELSNMKLLCCGACEYARYCSKKCQQDEWKIHRSLCKKMNLAKQYISVVKKDLRPV